MRILLSVLLVSSPALAIVNGQPPAEDDRRFDAVGAWSHSAWLGLGNNPAFEHNWYGGATLIAPSLVATAKHLSDEGRPSGYYAVRFRRRIDGGLGSKQAGPSSYHHALVERVLHGPGDMALAWLVEPVTHIEPISVMQLGYRGLAGQPYIHAGWGQEGPGREEGPRNQLLLCDQNSLVAVRANAVSYPGLGPGGPPCAVNRYDSGGAVLVEQGAEQVWLLATHKSYSDGPTLGPWLENIEVPILHHPFEAMDLALEDADVATRYPLRGRSQTIETQISNPGPARAGGEQPELLVEMRRRGDEEGAWQLIGTERTGPDFEAAVRRSVAVDALLPRDTAIGVWDLRLRLESNGPDHYARNNSLSLNQVHVRDREDPFGTLATATVVRPADGGVDLVVAAMLTRNNGSRGFWLSGLSADGQTSFSTGRAFSRDQTITVATPFGDFSWDPENGRTPLINPEGFTGNMLVELSGIMSAYAGIYFGSDQAGHAYTIALRVTGALLGGWTTDDGGQPYLDVIDPATLTAPGSGLVETGLSGVDLVWDEDRNLPRLNLQFEGGENVVLWREEQPSAPYHPCRESRGCFAHEGDETMVCARRPDQEFGLCTRQGCASEDRECPAGGACVDLLDLCAPPCADGGVCPADLTCNEEQVCVDCVATPALCSQADAGPPADAGSQVDGGGSGEDGGSSAQDSGETAPEAGTDGGIPPSPDTGSSTDAGEREPLDPEPATGCGCSSTGVLGGSWLLLMALLGRRRRAS